MEQHKQNTMSARITGKLGNRLMAAFLGVGLLPFAILAGLAYWQASSALEKEIGNKFEAIRDDRKAALEQNFKRMMSDVKDLQKNARITNGVKTFSSLFRQGVTSGAFQAQHAQTLAGLKSLQEAQGVYDIFFIDPSGNVVYTLAKESDLGQNVVTGPLKNSGLGRLFQQAKKEVHFEDFAYYEPSKAPAAFAGTPIYDNGKFLGVAAVQVSLDNINAITQIRTGMGESGEVYLVGPDHHLRSDSTLTQEMNVTNSFNKDKKVETDSAVQALAGKSGVWSTTDYRGVETYTAYGPVKAGDYTWALMAEIDLAEAFSPITMMMWTILAVALVGTVLIILAGLILARSITTPILQVSDTMKVVAGGDFTARVNVNREDEIGQLANAINSTVGNLQDLFRQFTDNAKSLASNSEELSAVATQLAASTDEMTHQAQNVASSTEEMSANINSMATGVEEMSVNVNSVSTGAEQMTSNVSSVASSVEEMSSSFEHISQAANEASNVAGKAQSLSNNASDTMNSLGVAAKEIGEVTEVIKRIAEQTNLLALNATIEAASAGDAGKGFAVVANEIKELANQSAGAAENIAKKIGDIQKRTDDAVKVISNVTGIIGTINDSVGLITKSVNEQSQAAGEIANNVGEASRVVSNVAASIAEVSKGSNDMSRNAGEAARGANEISNNIQGINQAVGGASSGIQQISASANTLAQMAGDLEKAVQRFRV
ncbi:MAG: methyl-accepting chemotaxis protein [Deltaproteobacteria bacterium]|nr:methyl-accepting chemotaxis protein [Deltaproteobacteria bacterium]